MFITKTALTQIASVLTVLVVAACSTGSKDDESRTSSAASGSACAGDEEEANDKITCTVDADCDSDEVCTEGLCTGLDGEAEDDEAECSEADDGDEAEEADESDDVDEAGDVDAVDGVDDEEEGADKITCTVDTDCDADEVCTSGLCT